MEQKFCTGCGASLSELMSSKKACCPDGRFRTFTELATSEARLQRELQEIKHGARCTNCGKPCGTKRDCCDNPRHFTWEQLVELERLTFTRLLRVEIALEEKYNSKEDIKKVLDEVARFKQPSLFNE